MVINVDVDFQGFAKAMAAFHPPVVRGGGAYKLSALPMGAFLWYSQTPHFEITHQCPGLTSPVSGAKIQKQRGPVAACLCVEGKLVL